MIKKSEVEQRIAKSKTFKRDAKLAANLVREALSNCEDLPVFVYMNGIYSRVAIEKVAEVCRIDGGFNVEIKEGPFDENSLMLKLW